jgi:DNA-binding MarR family transcriptional regulator
MAATRTPHVDPLAEARRQWRSRSLPGAEAVLTVGSVMRVQQLLLRSLEELLKPLDLTFARFEALLLLHFSANGELPLGKMGERLLVHPTSVTGTVDRLEAQGLIERVPHPSDRRATLARITEHGRQVAEDAVSRLAEARFGMAEWSDAELQQLSAMMQRVRREKDDIVDEA